MANFQVPAVFSAIDRITAPVRRIRRSVSSSFNRISNVVDRVDRKFISLGRTVGRLAGGFGLFVGGAALFTVLSGGVRTIADYEQANANLASVLGVSISQTDRLQESSMRLGASTAFTAAEVAGLQTEFAKLGFVESEILKVTKSTLALAAATRTELPQAAVQVGSALRAFGLGADQARRVSDVFAASTSKSALDMEKLNVSMSKVAPIAKQFGFSIENTIAFMAKLSDAGFDASTMATSTRSIFLNLADSNGKLAKALGGPARNIDEVTAAMVKMREKGIDLASMLGLTDKRSVAAFATFLDGAEGISALSRQLDNAGGTAERMARKQLDTLSGRATILNSAWEGLILSIDNGNGSFSTAAKRALEVTTEMLGLLSGTTDLNEATTMTIRNNRILADRILTVLKWVKNLAVAYIALKAVIVATRIVTTAYNVALGISAALQLSSVFALRSSAVAMAAFATATKIVTAVQWAWNAAMTANPIGLIIVGVAALIGLITAVVIKWDQWGASVSLFLGPLGAVISLIQSFRRHWDSVGKAFRTGGIIQGIKAIGLTIVDAILQPVQQLLQLIKKFTGFDLGVGAITGLRTDVAAGLGEHAPGVSLPAPSLNPDATREESVFLRTNETTQTKKVQIEIEDPGNNAKVEDLDLGDGITVQRTFGFE